LLWIIVLVLVAGVGGLYYMVLFGDVPELQRKVDLVSQRVDGLVQQSSDKDLDPVVVEDGESLVILSGQQKSELAEITLQQASERLENSKVRITPEDQL